MMGTGPLPSWHGGCRTAGRIEMSVLVFLVPAAIFLGGLGLLAFFWCMRTDQFDDPEGAARRILDDDK
jgi:cbb3-type cytochrome oxidase maturation protein